jgi:glycosyltransferase involved in cell wall biosynthesis
VIPTCIDTSRYEPRGASVPGPGLELVWIGSSSTLQGLEQQRSLWEQLGREVPGIRLRVICDRFPQFDGMPVIPVPWSEATEAREMALADVGIGWLPDDLWSRGKCGLKVIQYQAAGLPVLTNPVGVHPEMIEHGVSGFLATSNEQWIQAVRALAADPSLRQRMGRAARASVESAYSVTAWGSAFVDAVVDRTRGSPADAVSTPRLFKRGALSRSSREARSASRRTVVVYP